MRPRILLDTRVESVLDAESTLPVIIERSVKMGKARWKTLGVVPPLELARELANWLTKPEIVTAPGGRVRMGLDAAGLGESSRGPPRPPSPSSHQGDPT